MTYKIGDNPYEDKLIASLLPDIHSRITERKIALIEEVVEHCVYSALMDKNNIIRERDLAKQIKRVHERVRQVIGLRGKNPHDSAMEGLENRYKNTRR